jgi:hypothetical protein
VRSHDVGPARLAVAVARERQRQAPGTAMSAFFAVFIVLWLFFFVKQLAQGHVKPSGWLFASAALMGAAVMFGVWWINRQAPKAELANMDFLQRAGEPYPSDSLGEPAGSSVATRVLAAIALFCIYDLTYGALTLALAAKGLVLGAVVARGAVWAALMLIGNLTWMRRRYLRRSRRRNGGLADLTEGATAADPNQPALGWRRRGPRGTDGRGVFHDSPMTHHERSRVSERDPGV